MRVRIASYNVHKCRGLDGKTRPPRIAAVLRELDADVIALQEVLDVRGLRPEHDQAREMAAALPGYEWRMGEARRLHGGSYGNMTLSRWPMGECANLDLTWAGRERRACLRTEIRLSAAVVLRVVNVHLGTAYLERRRQVRRLLSGEVAGGEEQDRPRVIAGDFNEWTRGLTSKMLAHHLQTFSARSLTRHGRSYPGVAPFLHLDHIYFDAQLSLAQVRLHRSRQALLGSDHLPLVADLLIEA